MSARRLVRVVVAGVVAAAVVAAVASGASMLSHLRHALRRERRQAAELDERERIRRALAPITMKLDPAVWGEWLKPLPDDFDWDAFRRALPVLDPPLSQTIIDERDEYEESSR